MGFRAAVLSLLAVALFAGGAAARGKPQAPDRKTSDLTGVWTNVSATPIERPAVLDGLTVDAAGEAAYLKAYRKANAEADADVVGGGESEWWERGAVMLRIGGRARTSIVTEPVDGRLPWSPAGRAALAKGFALSSDDPERRTLSEQCLGGTPSRPPMLPHRSNSLYRFVLTRGHLVVWAESAREPRIVRIGPDPAGAGHSPAALRPWAGDSIGHWEGRTLVVETVNLNPRESVRWPYEVVVGPDAKVSERFTRIGPGEILYQFAVEDPANYTRPWRGEEVFKATPGPIYEYACHEGNYSLPGILAGARFQEKTTASRPSAAPNGG